jgi:septation ring formation regulator EzrA
MIEINGKTKQEVEQEKINQEWIRIRNKRDNLLKETDYLIMPDYLITDEDRILVENYRNELRNIPQNYSNPFEVVFPEKPDLV